MADVDIRVQGRAGRITLTRPQALNAVTWDMIRQIHGALLQWETDPRVDLVVIDAAGDRAFAAGGDIVDLYRTGQAGDYGFGRRFWAEEYRLNAKIAAYPKPFVALMHGFVMGGGVGLSCHGSHRIVDDSAQIAMPECAIGLIPDVGGTRLLAKAPGALGQYIGLTGHRMTPADAIHAGFADSYIPRRAWPDLIADLATHGDVTALDNAAASPPADALSNASDIDAWFSAPSLSGVLQSLEQSDDPAAEKIRKTLRRQSPLAAVCAFDAINAAKDLTLSQALAQEYRFVWRCMESGDFLEGIRAQVIDKDRNPSWKHASIEDVPPQDAAAMRAPLGVNEWSETEREIE